MIEKRAFESNFSNINGLLDGLIDNIFNGIDIDSMSNLEKRKRIYDYLVDNNDYDFELLNEILAGKRRYPAEEIYSILEGMEKTGRGKGVCNAFSYVYKLLLEKCKTPSMLIIGKIRLDDISELEQAGIEIKNIKRDSSNRYLIGHMFILVQNKDGSFSFDDPTCAILNREKGVNYFNYDKLGCAYRNQIELQGFSTDYIEAVIGRNNPPISDKIMSQKYDSGRFDGLLRLPDSIVSYIEEKDDRENAEIE